VEENMKKSLRPSVFLFLIVGLGLLARAAVLASGWVLGQWAKTLCHGATPCEAHALLHGFTPIDFLRAFAGLAIGGLAASFLFRVLLSWIAVKEVRLLHDQLFQGLARASFQFLDRISPARILQTSANDYSALLRFVGGSLGELFSHLIDIVLIVGIFVFTQPSDLLPLAVLAGGSYVIFKRNQKILAGHREAIAKTRADMLWAFREEIDGKLEIDVYGSQDFFTQRFSDRETAYYQQRTSNQRSLSRFSIQIAGLNALAILFLGAMAILKLRMGFGDIGQVIQSLTWLFLFSSSLQALFEMMARVEEARVATKGLQIAKSEIDSTLVQEAATLVQPETHDAVPAAELAVRDLSLAFQNPLPQTVLSDLNFTMGAREKIGVIGPSGSGKSTLVHSLLGHYPLASGHITFNGEDLADCPNLRPRLFSVVPQAPVLFAGTVAENLVGDERVSRDRLEQVVHELKLPLLLGMNGVEQTLDFVLKPGGTNIPASVRQVLGMARALLQERPVLIFDEPTSAMDGQVQSSMIAALRTLAPCRAQLRIAHTPDAIADCDRVLWLEKGVIRMIGTPAEIFPLYFKSHS
jgi:ABC-type multidrug transport system fused ATPase/permease subunit